MILIGQRNFNNSIYIDGNVFRLSKLLCEVKMVTLEKLKEARIETKRFLMAIEEAMSKLNKNRIYEYGCRETATVKRASMDLSNALVKLRKPNA